MATRYLLPCKCNHKLSVETRHAGNTIECPECSAMVDVPKLRELKNLELENPENDALPRAANPLKRLLFTLGLGVAVIAGVAGGLLYNYSSNMIGKDEKTRNEIAEFENADALLADASPGEMWDLWYSSIDDYELPEWKEAHWNKNYAQGTILRNFAYGILGIAGIGLLTALCSFLIGSKKS